MSSEVLSVVVSSPQQILKGCQVILRGPQRLSGVLRRVLWAHRGTPTFKRVLRRFSMSSGIFSSPLRHSFVKNIFI